ncbi:hypothetical protein J1N35_034037 [Gossypium stocksii]|uniref:Uncharacterized protein n=1 Tax=Gossypium stocksii TaxID=47602 RepID=A0A9D3ZQ21_9ROSI|nr:hypothetical protein J1N35_034037 [Gossypium stocksii]
MGTPIHLTLEEFGDYLHLPSGGYHFDAATNTWMKHDQPRDNQDDDVDAAFDDILVPDPVAPPPSSSHAAQPSSKVNSAILDAIRSLSNNIQGLREDFNSRLSTLERQMASLFARFPSTPLFSSYHDD